MPNYHSIPPVESGRQGLDGSSKMERCSGSKITPRPASCRPAACGTGKRSWTAGFRGSPRALRPLQQEISLEPRRPYEFSVWVASRLRARPAASGRHDPIPGKAFCPVKRSGSTNPAATTRCPRRPRGNRLTAPRHAHECSCADENARNPLFCGGMGHHGQFHDTPLGAGLASRPRGAWRGLPPGSRILRGRGGSGLSRRRGGVATVTCAHPPGRSGLVSSSSTNGRHATAMRSTPARR